MIIYGLQDTTCLFTMPFIPIRVTQLVNGLPGAGGRAPNSNEPDRYISSSMGIIYKHGTLVPDAYACMPLPVQEAWCEGQDIEP